ncbi:hypothetical protein ACQKGL_12390 [Ensifer adhaerens]|uniref:hypothetical protein n=1 Tax=Ensifer adhaerens TaxID=106592 RepID=UPI003D0319F1
MIVTVSFLLGIAVCSLRSARACLFAGTALLALAGAAGDWIQAAAAIGAYNMGVALMICGALAIGLERDR